MKLLALLAAVWMLASCSSSTRSTALEPQTSTEREPWFCETGEENEQWQCVQSEALAADPKPTRLPPRRTENPSSTPLAASSASGRTFRQSIEPAATVPAAPPVPTSNQPRQPAPPPETQQTEPQVAENPSEQNLPKHIALAYRPDKAVSILDLPGDFWAVQLIALSSKEALEEFAKQHNIRGMSAARIAANEKLYFVLLLGIYETRALAEEASAGLPAPFDNPWVRSIASLQAGMQAADALTGTATP